MAKFVGKVEFPCTIELGRGLEGAITNQTTIGFVNGEAGELNYRGYSIQELCEHSTFEETSFLLLFGRLPKSDELARFQQRLRTAGSVPPSVLRLIESMPTTAHPMSVLQTAVAALGCHDEQGQVVTRHASDPASALEAETDVTIRLLASISTVSGAIARARQGKPVLAPDPSLSYTANYLYMTNGVRPDAVTEKVLDVCLILQADHGMNASTFTAMVVHSSLADMYSTIAAAIGSLRGPLHGGANEAALADIQSIGTPDKAKAWVSDRLSKHGKVIGFGHRVYKAYDPRATVLKKFAQRLCEQKGVPQLYETAAAVEEAVCAAMAAAGKKIFPNVDFYSGIVYHALGFETPLFPVIFAVSRMAGWGARVLEYLPENRIFRPRAVYTGQSDLKYVPLSQR